MISIHRTPFNSIGSSLCSRKEQRVYSRSLEGSAVAALCVNEDDEEFDLPEEKSLFLALVKIRKETISVFLDHLIGSNFAFGILVDPFSSQASIVEPANLLSSFFHAAVRPGRVVEIDRPAGIELLTGDQVLAFDLDVDNQNRQYLEFYGPRALIHAIVHQFLIPRLKEGFRFADESPEKSGA